MKIIKYISILIALASIILLGKMFWNAAVPPSVEQNKNPYQQVQKEDRVIPADVGFRPEETILFSDIVSRDTSSAFSEVLRHVHDNVYLLYTCSTDPEDKVLMLTAKYASDGSFAQVKEVVREWESYILQDVGNLLFPSLKSSQFRKIFFADVPGTQYRRATTEISGVQKTLYVGWRLNYVFFASSQECLDETMNEVYPDD